MKPILPPPPPLLRSAAGMLARILGLLVVLLVAWPDLPTHAASDPGHGEVATGDDRAQLVHLLDYIAVDYPDTVTAGHVTDLAEYAEQKEFAARLEALLRQLPTPAAGEAARVALLQAAADLAAAIHDRADGKAVAAACRRLRQDAIGVWKIRVAPRQSPDPARGAALYTEHCATCHGSQGHGDGSAGSGLEPPPANFHDAARMSKRSLLGLYNAISLGVAGTAMPAFAQIDEAGRWDLAFHIGGLAATPEALASGAAVWRRDPAGAPLRDLAAVAGSSAEELAAGPGGAAAVVLLAWLTQQPQALEVLRPEPLQLARQRLGDSLAALASGRREEAGRLAIAAYLDGFELAEAALDSVDRPLRLQIEAGMMAYRQGLGSAPELELRRRAAELDRLLQHAAEVLGGKRLNPLAAAFSAFGILFREGLEAILVLAAIAAGVRRSGGSPDVVARAMRCLHAGWIAALAAGAATWLLAQQLIVISGASREITEGVSALASAAILLYVGFWLHGQAQAGEWQRFLGDRLDGALSRGTLGLLVGLAFLAVYREAFETVLFFEALAAQAAADAAPAIAGGAAVATLALLVTAWAVFRTGLRLPLALFFRASAGLLALLAVVFAGQGVAALQEAGSIGSAPLGSLSLPALGLYPTQQTLAAQLLVLGTVALIFWRQRRAAICH